jgi:hypothetical protein
MCGGQDETAVADTSDDATEQGWTETVGSGLLVILSIGQTQEPDQTKPSEEVRHASSDLCTRLDPEPGGRSND